MTLNGTETLIYKALLKALSNKEQLSFYSLANKLSIDRSLIRYYVKKRVK